MVKRISLAYPLSKGEAGSGLWGFSLPASAVLLTFVLVACGDPRSEPVPDPRAPIDFGKDVVGQIPQVVNECRNDPSARTTSMCLTVCESEPSFEWCDGNAP